MFRQDRTNPSTAISNWRGRLDTLKGWPSTAVSAWLNGGLFGAAVTGAGYWAGGWIPGSPNSIKQISKLLYADDSCAAITPVLTYTNYESGGYANAGVSGYWVGGRQDGSSTLLTLINKTDFDDDSTSTASGSLDAACRFFAGLFANSGTAGYSCGGSPATGRSDAIEKLLFADDSCGAITPVLSQTTRAGAGCADSGTAGYQAGGNPDTSYTAVINKTAFSDDSTAAIVPTLSLARWGVQGLANGSTAGYWAGVAGASLSAVIDKTAFSDDSTAAITPTLVAVTRWAVGASNSGTAGYWGGGYIASSANTAEIDKTDFSDDSTAGITADLATAVNYAASCSNDSGL